MFLENEKFPSWWNDNKWSIFACKNNQKGFKKYNKDVYSYTYINVSV